jgi:hypothetical protein
VGAGPRRGSLASQTGRRRLEFYPGNQIGNHNQQISWRGVAHYGASSEGEPGFSGGASALIMPGSRVRVPPLLLTPQPLGRSRSSGLSHLAPHLALSGREQTVASIDIEGLRKRIVGIKAGLQKKLSDGRVDPAVTQGGIQSTVAVLATVYGANSHQVQEFIAWSKQGGGSRDIRAGNFEYRVAKGIPEVLDAALADHESGLIASLRVLATGEVLGDFVALARAALATGLAESARVGAVLAAASLEETLKKLGELNDVDVSGGVSIAPASGQSTGHGARSHQIPSTLDS